MSDQNNLEEIKGLTNELQRSMADLKCTQNKERESNYNNKKEKPEDILSELE